MIYDKIYYGNDDDFVEYSYAEHKITITDYIDN